jgi:hypothetical protein
MKRLFLAAFFSFTLLSISSKSEAQVLINYWNFNNFTAVDTFGSAFNPIPLIDADYSAISTTNAYIRYAFDSGTTVKSEDSCWIDGTTGSTVNAQQGASAGNCLRVRNPSDFTALEFFIPTTNFKNITVSYALQSSSAKSGQAVEVFAYSVDSGVTWKTASLTVNGANVDTLLDTGLVYINGFGLVTIGFGSDTTVNNTTKLVLRMTFKSYSTGAISGTSGNARLDNIAVMGSYLKTAITVQTPTAGTILYGGQQQTISYLPSGAITPTRTIYLSTDSGYNWKQILSTSQTSYAWTVPSVNSTNCFIEVIDSNGITGKSGRFTIRPPTITLVQPTGGGTFITGSSVLISYLTFGAVTNFRALDYSIDSGRTWTEIAISTADTFTWTIPYANSHTCFLEVTDQNGSVAKSGIFTILSVAPPPPPAGGLIQYWNFNNLATTTTYKVPNVPHIDADYSALDTSKAFLEYYLEPGTSSSYGSANGSDNLDGVASADTANLRLGVPSGNALRVRNPVDSIELRWHIPSTGYNNLVVKFTVESSSTGSGDSTQIYSYSTDAGVTWKSASITVYGVNVDTMNTTSNPLMQGANWGLVTVTLGNDLTVNNNPNLIFRIIFKGNTHLLSGNNRIDDFTVDGTQGAPPPPPPPVKDSISVSAPATGDTLLAGTKQTISYAVTSTTGKARSIDYSINGGTTWTSVATNDSALTYSWTVPATPTPNGLIRVKDSAGVIGVSGKFVIVVPGTVASVTLPSQNVIGGTTTNITWSASGYLGNSMEIDVAYDGVTWNPIITGLSATASGSYPWTVPKTLYNGVLVRVVFASGATGTSVPFNIVATADVAGTLNSQAKVEIWPNPLQSQATIQYELTSSANVSFSVHDLLGREVENIQEGMQSAGEHEVIFDGSQIPAGVYRYELIVDNTSSQGQLVIVH